MHIHTNSGIVRAGLRFYFIIVLLFIALVGDNFCHLRVKLRLLRGQQVNVSLLTGWIRGINSFRICARLRRLPGGWLGMLMILSAVLAIIADLTVSGFVVQEYQLSRCEFKRGLVVDPSRAHEYPSPWAAAFKWADFAQGRSNAWGGKLGIYNKLDDNIYFSAVETDLLGGWSCHESADRIEYNGSSDQEIYQDLVNQELLYRGDPDPLSNTIMGSTTQLVFLTAPPYQESQPWSIKAAVDVEDDTTSNGKIMQPYNCAVYETVKGSVELIIAQINTTWTLRNWGPSIQGFMYDGMMATKALNNPDFYLEWMLNNMAMVSGGYEMINTPYEGDNPWQGCYFPGTYVPGGVIFIFLLVGFLAMGLVFYYIFLHFQIGAARREYDDSNTSGLKVTSREICENVPNGLLDWMSHAAHESGNTEKKPRHVHLKNWLLSTSQHEGRRMGVVPRGRPQVSASAASLLSSNSMQSPAKEASMRSFPVSDQRSIPRKPVPASSILGSP